MRRLFLLTLVFLFFAFNGCEKAGEEDIDIPKDDTNWEIIHTHEEILPTIFAGHVFSGGQTIFIGGDAGFLIKSTNGGIDWTQMTVGGMADSGYSVRAIDFADDQHGVIGGDFSLYCTADGGATWILVGDTSYLNENKVVNIKYVGGTDFYALTGTSFLRSNDNGLNWEETRLVESDTAGYGLLSFAFEDAEHGMILTSEDYAFYTSDGGDTWEEEAIEEYTKYDIGVNGDGVYYITGDTARVSYRTAPGEWTLIGTEIPSEFESQYILNSIEFSGDLGIAVGNNGAVCISTDGGASWPTTDALSSYGEFTSAKFAPDGNYVIVVGIDDTHGLGCARLGSNNFDSWIGLNYGTIVNLHGLAFVNSLEGVFVGNQNSIYKTYNGGETLCQRVAESGQDITFAGIDFSSENDGIAVGTDGAILLTGDGGEHWSFIEEGALTIDVDHFSRIQIIDANIAYAIGLDDDGNGLVVKTEDGGVTWNSQTTGVVADLLDIHFTDSNTGWVVGDAGTIISTADGGTNWETQSSGSYCALTGVFFIDSSTGWICGNNAILRTTDGGANWESMEVQPNLFGHFRDIAFINSESGWIVGNFGYILHTIDGGETWYRQAVGYTEMNLYSIEVLDDTHIWISGEMGMVMKLIP